MMAAFEDKIHLPLFLYLYLIPEKVK